MKKKLLAMVLGTAMLFGTLAGCGGTGSAVTEGSTEGTVEKQETAQSAETEETAEADGGEKKTLKIGMAWAILDDGQTNLTNGIKACFENAFPDYRIETTLTNADSDISKLIDDVESQIAKNPDVIFIMNSVGGEGIVPAINACAEAGIPVGIGSAIESDAPYTYLYEGFSHYACGEMQAKYMNSIYDETKEYYVACISGDAETSTGPERLQGFTEKFVDIHDNASVVVTGEGNFNTDDSQSLTEDWLISNPEINVICCVNDDEAQGAINACKAAGREDVIILGIDGSDVGKANVEAGDQAATVAIDFAGVAMDCAQAMVDCAEGKITGEKNEVKYTTENLNLITKE